MTAAEPRQLTRVHRQNFVVAKHVGDELLIGAQLVVVKGPGGQGEPGGLRLQRSHDLGVTVALVDGAVSAQEVVVAFALDVPHVNS